MNFFVCYIEFTFSFLRNETIFANKWHIPEQSMKFELDEDVTFLFAPIESGRPLNSLDDISMKGVKSIGYRPTIHELYWVADTILKKLQFKIGRCLCTHMF